MRKTLTVVVAALAIGLAGCTTSSDDANTQSYPQEAKDNFVDFCTSEAAKTRGGNEEQRRDQCRCIIENLETTQKLPYDRAGDGEGSFKDADTAVKDGRELSPRVRDDLNRATADCVGSR